MERIFHVGWYWIGASAVRDGRIKGPIYLWSTAAAPRVNPLREDSGHGHEDAMVFQAKTPLPCHISNVRTVLAQRRRNITWGLLSIHPRNQA